MKMSVEFCRIPRPERPSDRGGRERGRDSRRSRSPIRRRHSRSRSRDRGSRDRDRSRDREYWPRDGYRGDYPPPPPFDPYSFPPSEFSRPPLGGPLPPSRPRSGLLDPPFPIGSEPGRGGPPGPPRGYRDDPPQSNRDSYGPPPSRGGFSGSRGK